LYTQESQKKRNKKENPLSSRDKDEDLFTPAKQQQTTLYIS
jgi:hypothetical protein